jgi:hypothetical protein
LKRNTFGNPERASTARTTRTLGARAMVRSTAFTLTVLGAVILGFLMGAAEALLHWRWR